MSSTYSTTSDRSAIDDNYKTNEVDIKLKIGLIGVGMFFAGLLTGLGLAYLIARRLIRKNKSSLIQQINKSGIDEPIPVPNKVDQNKFIPEDRTQVPPVPTPAVLKSPFLHRKQGSSNQSSDEKMPAVTTPVQWIEPSCDQSILSTMQSEHDYVEVIPSLPKVPQLKDDKIASHSGAKGSHAHEHDKPKHKHREHIIAHRRKSRYE